MPFRFIRKSPTFSITVILTLALAIGANSAVFSAIDAILLRPLPFPDADQLVRVEQYNPKVASPNTYVSPVRLEDWNRLNSTFRQSRATTPKTSQKLPALSPRK
jgi:putative ABC transport system permease protein